MMSRRGSLAILAALAVAALLLAPSAGQAQNASAKLANGKVTPTGGDDRTEFTFVVRYSDADNDTPAFVQVVIDKVPHDMQGVDPADDNCSNGKDYYYKTTLEEGTYVFYFQCSDGTNVTKTTALTLPVESTSILRMEHSDIIKVVLTLSPFAAAIMLLLVFELHRINRNISRISPREQGHQDGGTVKGPVSDGDGEAGERPPSQ